MKEHTEDLAGWGNYPVVSSQVVSPAAAKEWKQVITESSLIARGLGRSYGDQAINRDRLVGINTRMHHFLDWNEEEGVLECEAGASLEEIISCFAPRGWLPMICPGTKFVTIGGAIANDVHGKAHHADGSFVNCVLSFTIMLANGSIVTASRTENPDLFISNFGGLGLLGVILTARIQLRKIETTYFRQQSFKVKNLEDMLAALDKYQHFNYSVAWIDAMAKGRRLGRGVLTVGDAALFRDLPRRLKKDPLKAHKVSKLNVPVFMPAFVLNNFTVGILNRVISFVQNSPKEFVHYEKFFFPLDMINNWNRGYGKRGFIQYQFVIPEKGGENVLRKIMQMIADSGCTPFLNVFKKMGKGQGILSFPFEGYTLAIDFPVTKGLKAFTLRLDEAVLEAGGRLYLGKDAMLEKEMFRQMYPQYREWLAIKKKYDPENTFSSDISRRLGLEA
ncbi:MAG: FAD-binding oxidoreductase [Chitinophagaceae bacterium]|nr:FAD-binding oxidoreductase [Chitinophagaceae bacterium]MCW5927839.1 FAD-binding oxidoreductase [Chitinophagaceae bacterium]